MKAYMLLVSLILVCTTKLVSYRCCLENATFYDLPAGSYGPRSLAFSPDGTLLATANSGSTHGEGDITLFAVTDGMLNAGTSYSSPMSITDPSCITFSPDGSLLAAADDVIGGVNLFNVMGTALNPGSFYRIPTNSSYPVCVAFSPDNSLLATANAYSDDVTIFTVNSNKTLNGGTSYDLLTSSREPLAVAFSPDGSLLAVANNGLVSIQSGDLTLFTVMNGILNNKTAYSMPSGLSNLDSIAFSPNGSLLATGDTYADKLTMFTVTGDHLSTGTSYALPADSLRLSLAFSPDGSLLAVAHYSSRTVFIFTVNGEVLSEVTTNALPQGLPTSIAFSPDGRFVGITPAGSKPIAIFAVSCANCTTSESSGDVQSSAQRKSSLFKNLFLAFYKRYLSTIFTNSHSEIKYL